jgi:NitT/TauT family transport system substrate-binding protein
MKRIILLCLAIAAVLGTIGVLLVRNPAPSPRSVTGVAPKPITIANIGLFSGYNVIADQKGFFARNGLDAEVREYDSGATSLGALLSGEADVAVAANFVGVRNIFMNPDLRILATANSHDVWRVIALTDRGIGRPLDLKGKKVGLTRKTAAEFYLGKFLETNGMALEDVVMTDLPASEMRAQLETGAVDAVMVFDPNAFLIQQALASHIIVWPAQGGRRELATVYTTRRFVEEHPDIAEAYLRSLVDAESFQSAHEDEAKAVIAETFRYDDEYIDRLWSEFTFAIRLDQDLLLTMEDQARWIIANGLTEATRVPDYLGSISFGPLETAKPGGVTILH